jgi:predicted HTH domain antitoxin
MIAGSGSTWQFASGKYEVISASTKRARYARISFEESPMAVTFQLEPLLEDQLRRDLGDLNSTAKEALLVSLYRQGKLSHHELSQELGLDRFATEAVLKKHNVTEDLPSVEELEADRQTLERLLKPER